MALYGAMYPVIATATFTPAQGATAASIAYSAAKVLTQLARCDVTENYVNGKYDADDRRVIYKQKYIDTDISLEVQNLALDDFKQLYGHTITTQTNISELKKSGSDIIPNIAYGFIHVEALEDGTEKWVAHFFPWSQATPAALNYATQSSDAINLAGHGLTMKAYDDPVDLIHEYVEEFSTEAAAKAYLNSKVNLS